MRILILIAWRNLLAHKAKNLSLGAAIAATAACLTLLLALTAGIAGTLKTATTTLFSGDLNVNGFSKLGIGSWAPYMNQRTELLAQVRAALPEARLVTDRYMGRGSVVSAKTSMETPLWGVDYASESPEFKALRLADAAEFGKGELSGLAKRGTIVLWAKQARVLEAKVGDSLMLNITSVRGTSNSVDLKVVAVLKDWGMMSSFSLLINRADMQALRQTGENSTGQVAIYLPRNTDLAEAEPRLRKFLEQKGWRLRPQDGLPLFMKFDEVAAEPWLGTKLDTSNWRDECSYLNWMLFLLNALFKSVISVMLLIIAIGILNAMNLAVSDRTPELGTLRALGMQREAVLSLMLWEGLLLAAVASGLGTALGAFLSLVLTAFEIPLNSEAIQTVLLSDRLIFIIRPLNLAISFGAITILTSLASLYPAWKASRLRPVEAMQAVAN